MIRYFRKGVYKFWERVTLLSLELVVVLIAFFAALMVFILITKMVFLEKRDNLDEAVFSFFHKHVSTANTGLMEVFSFLGSHYFLIPANLLLTAYFLFVKKLKWHSIKVPVISLSSLLLMFLLKQFFHRERPMSPLLKAAKGLSFPSGHSLMSFTFYGLLVYLSWQYFQKKSVRFLITVPLVLLIFLIGASRIYLRVHYASDVIAGFSLGLVWLVLSVFVLNKMERMGNKRINTISDDREQQESIEV